MQAFRQRKTPARERGQGEKRSPPKPVAKPARKGASFALRSAVSRTTRRRTFKLTRASFLGRSIKGKAAQRVLHFQNQFSGLGNAEGPASPANKTKRKQIVSQFLQSAFGEELKGLVSRDLKAKFPGQPTSTQAKAELKKWETELEKALNSKKPLYTCGVIESLNPKFAEWTELEKAARAEYAIRWLRANFGSLLKRK